MNHILTHLTSADLTDVKAAYTTRRIKLEDKLTLLKGGISPRAGDLTLAKVTKLGHHSRLELNNGRRARLFHGDHILLCYGNRYAPDQFEAVVPDSLASAHMAAAGGIIARVLSKHGKMKKPTKLLPLGILGSRSGRPLNLIDFGLEQLRTSHPRPLTIAVMGTAMNSGKTTTAAYLIKGLVNSGLKVGAAKITGTGAGGDIWFMKDAGARPVLDFIDAGFASTYKITSKQIDDIMAVLIRHLVKADVEAIVLEFSDGLYQDEIADLLCTSAFGHEHCRPALNRFIDGLIFAAHDAMGANAGVRRLRRSRLPVLALSGLITQSPLAIRESQEATGLPVLDSHILSNRDIYMILKRMLSQQHRVKLKAA